MTTGGFATSAAAAPRTGSQAPADEVDVTVEVGIAGVVVNQVRQPVRVTITSERSRTVALEVDNSVGSQYFEVELNAGAPAVVDTVLQSPTDRVEATVRSGSRRIGSATLRSRSDRAAMLVGVGPSLAAGREPWSSPTIGEIQEATLVRLDDDLLDRPGALDVLAGVVLGPADVDRLDVEDRARLAVWVARGGNLALDMDPTSPLPVLDVDAEPGDRTAIEAGWARFTRGAAGRGEWTSVVEPVTAFDAPQSFDEFANDMGFSRPDGELRFAGLINVEYLSSGLIAAAVFLTALLVGPLLWFLLRSRGRRRLMWVLAPTLSVAIAALITTLGQGALSDASTLAIGGVTSTAWGTDGEFGFGTSGEDAELEIGRGALWASGPRIQLERSAAGTARQDLGPNSFGYVGLGEVSVDSSALVEVTAVARNDDLVDVTVHNRSRLRLFDLSISGFTRAETLDAELGPGESTTVEFRTGAGRSAFGSVFPSADNDGTDCWMMTCFSAEITPWGRANTPAMSAVGRLEVRGLMSGPLTVAGTERTTVTQVLARTVVRAADGSAPAHSTVRVESVGATESLALAEDGFGPLGPGGAGGNLPVPTTDDVGAGLSFPEAGGDGGGMSFPGAGNGTADTVVSFVSLSSPTERNGLRCDAHTVVDTVEQWAGGGWTPVATTGPAHEHQGFHQPRQTRTYELGNLAAGEVRFLRLTSTVPIRAAATILCEVAP